MIEHVLNDADTIQGLAVLYNVKWQDIADYNRLEYPYTMTSKQAYYELFAGGYIKISRDQIQQVLTLYAGSQFVTEQDAQGIQKQYELTEDATLDAGSSEGYFYIRCTTAGSFGNTIAGSIIGIGSIQSNISYGQLTITNPDSFSNGKDAKVRLTGQVIYIDDSDQITQKPSISYIQELAGTDLLFTPDGDLIDNGSGDWDSVSGSENIQQSANNRLVTRRGSLTQHPTYGSRLHELIGIAQAPYVKKLIELDVIETLLDDERIESVVVNFIEVTQTSIYVDITITAAGTESQLQTTVAA